MSPRAHRPKSRAKRRLDGCAPPPDFQEPQCTGHQIKRKRADHEHGSTFRFHIEVGNRRVQEMESLRVAEASPTL